MGFKLELMVVGGVGGVGIGGGDLWGGLGGGVGSSLEGVGGRGACFMS